MLIVRFGSKGLPASALQYEKSKMKLIPNVSINGILYGASRDDVMVLLGNPIKEIVTKRNEIELQYPNSRYRFDTDRLVEVTVNTEAIEIEERTVRFKDLEEFLKGADPEVFDRAGFIVSPRYALSFDSDFPCWITVYPNERTELWKGN